MELQQTGNKVTGHFALRGNSEIEGLITGRQLEFTFKAFKGGKGWFDVSPDGRTLGGAAHDEGDIGWFGWAGRRAPEFIKDVKLIPAKMVDGATKGLLTYTVRAPVGYKEGDGKKWPAILILHGSNMNGKAYVNTLAATWPDIAKDYILIGINGERPASIGAEAVFNYTYVSFVGRSTFNGFPGTDRESPALVAEAMTELKATYPISKYFVGGHSQGGFLTYSLLMNFPEMVAGAFPISAGVINQCEPTAYTDEKVLAAQRRVPVAIIHSKTDSVVGFGTGEYAATLFGEANWPAFHFFADNSKAGHRFGLLPVSEAIRWLEAQSADDVVRLIDHAEKQVKSQNHRDAIAAILRARTLAPNDLAAKKLDALSQLIDAKAVAGAKEFLQKISDNKDGKWVDRFLKYRDEYEFSPASAEVMTIFKKLRADHDAAAKKTLNEANALFEQSDRNGGYAKYQEIIDKYYAASSYRNVKRWIAERK